MTPLEQWLGDATRGLSPESAARVRTEIEQHYESAREDGGDAIAALGDPRAANRGYRKVLLTEQEAMLAPVITQPRRPSVLSIALSIAMLGVFLWWMGSLRTSAGYWPITIAIFSTLPLSWFYPLNSLERSRNYLWIHGARSLVVAGVAWWYQGWVGALVLGAVCLLLEYPNYRRIVLFRKIDAGQTFSALPGEPELTRLEAIWLNTLRKGSGRADNVAAVLVPVMLVAMAVWMPGTFAPMAVSVIVGILARRLRIVRWTAMGIAAVLPPLYGARAPFMGAVMLAMFFYLFDYRSIVLRRKLPVEQWPARLYW